MSDVETTSLYFEKAGPQNTDATLRVGLQRAQELGLRHVVVATTSGETGAKAARAFQGRNIVVVTHSTGFRAANEQSLQPEFREQILAAGARILTCQHALGGIGRAVRRKLGTYQIDEIVAFTLRNLGDGIKVACEITVMAADAGLIPVGEEVLTLSGTGSGADTAAIVLSANGQDFFDLRVVEIICKPRMGRLSPS